MNEAPESRVALVTAASRGLGYASAEALVRQGFRVVICGRNEARLRDAALALSDMAESRDAVRPVVADLTRHEMLDALVATCVQEFGRLDVLVINIAHPQMGGIETLDEDDWRRGFEQIFVSTLRLVRLVLPHMRRAGFGRIINISSHAVKEPGSTYVISGVFRTALAALFKSVSHEVGRDGIRVNTICPGLVRTQLGHELIQARAERSGVSVDEAERAMAAPTAIGRVVEPAELGELVAFLCSDGADAITGQLLSLDGGKGRGLL